MPCYGPDQKEISEMCERQKKRLAEKYKRKKTDRELYVSLLRHHQLVEQKLEKVCRLISQLSREAVGNIAEWNGYTMRDESGVMPESVKSSSYSLGWDWKEDWLRDEDYKK